MPRRTDTAVVLGFFALAILAGVFWSGAPGPTASGGSPAGGSPSNRATPSPSLSPLPPCTIDLVVSTLIHQRQLVGNPRPYLLPSPVDPAPEAGVRFDLPQSYATSPAFILIFPTVSARVRAQSAFAPSSTVGGSGRLIWSFDSLAASDSAPYSLVLDSMTTSDQPCGQPAG